MTARPKITLEDLRAAFLLKHRVSDWDRLLSAARHNSIDRAIRENLEKQAAAVDAAKSQTGAKWIRTQSRLTALFREHDDLVRMAFPPKEKT